MPGPHGGTLRVAALCAFCESPTEESCRLCGRAVCADHLTETQICADCASGRRIE